MLQAFSQRAEAIGPDIIHTRLVFIEGQHVEIHQIMCMDELKTNIAAADHINVYMFPDFAALSSKFVLRRSVGM